MQTRFTPEQLADPATARSNRILRACVHCGFCTATCPTYQVLGDELDSPRGRIYLIKDMLENARTPDARTVRHVDRCLSCLSCMTTCPSGVDYMHLVDHARAYIEQTYRRPFAERVLRALLAAVLPHPGRFRLALRAARLARPFARTIPEPRLRAMLEMAPRRLPRPASGPVPRAPGTPRMRVALMTGCAQQVLSPEINAATIRLLTRLGAEVVVPPGAGCCGALTHHMGRSADSHASAGRNIRAWMAERRGKGLDAVVINTSGCGTTVKDYGQMFRDDPLAPEAAEIASLACDVTELVERLGLPEVADPPGRGLRVAYHPACSLQHGQRIRDLPKALLARAGYAVVLPAEAHLCCGSAGTYNLLQPEISGQLRRRKVAALEVLDPQVIAAGNLGCMMQIGAGTGLPLVHTVQLLDWATGGPRPPALGPAEQEKPVPAAP
ncbi:glycolate oxidase subunit GlcF [Pseudooceanicola sp. CBS1P-1]|uniref:Glycolate oxidase iron-sulfur subunit n=1 Tax=Pseudooceanicola albus TaxID=2692189 RepID=A0A6L7FZ49_9RHOB|nr:MULTISPECIES: glycolate oxidase subunit GlcF [Pseudooceanicola]MBT9384032.1 glycolate oxidase subunit GlcF [Pseudooceanicola endophyticus]MXN16556.1 glycolate oxidase subunit GlcF [Pseudooceanicola albus]